MKSWQIKKSKETIPTKNVSSENEQPNPRKNKFYSKLTSLFQAFGQKFAGEKKKA